MSKVRPLFLRKNSRVEVKSPLSKIEGIFNKENISGHKREVDFDGSARHRFWLLVISEFWFDVRNYTELHYVALDWLLHCCLLWLTSTPTGLGGQNRNIYTNDSIIAMWWEHRCWRIIFSSKLTQQRIWPFVRFRGGKGSELLSSAIWKRSSITVCFFFLFSFPSPWRQTWLTHSILMYHMHTFFVFAFDSTRSCCHRSSAWCVRADFFYRHPPPAPPIGYVPQDIVSFAEGLWAPLTASDPSKPNSPLALTACPRNKDFWPLLLPLLHF